LLFSTAWASSFPQISELTESGLMTKTNAWAASMAALIYLGHSAMGGMSYQSTQMSRGWAPRASWSLRTKPRFLRE